MYLFGDWCCNSEDGLFIINYQLMLESVITGIVSISLDNYMYVACLEAIHYFLHFLLAFVKYKSYGFVWDKLNVSDFWHAFLLHSLGMCHEGIHYTVGTTCIASPSIAYRCSNFTVFYSRASRAHRAYGQHELQYMEWSKQQLVSITHAHYMYVSVATQHTCAQYCIVWPHDISSGKLCMM